MRSLLLYGNSIFSLANVTRYTHNGDHLDDFLLH